MLLLLFSIFLYYTVSEVFAERGGDPIAKAAAERAPTEATWAGGRAALLAAAGLGLLLVGAQLTVSSAVSLTEALDVPRVVIGLTVVALGTSLPELATSLVAASRGQASLAVGSIVGSNIFNLLFVLGTTAVIRPVEVPPPQGGADLAALATFSGVLVLLSRSPGSTIVRWQGVMLLLAYLGYVTWRFTS